MSTLTQAGMVANIQWALDQTNAPFQDTTQGPDAQSFTLNGVNLSTFNLLFAASYTIAAGGNQIFNLFSFSDLICGTDSMTKALSILVLNVSGTGATAVLSPGGSNPLNWFFGGTSPTITIQDGGMFAYSNPATGPGATVSNTAKNMTITEGTGVDILTVTVVVIGGA